MELSLLSSRIIAYRAYTGLGQAHFAKRVGVSLVSLKKLESGEALPRATRDPFIAALKKRDIHPDQPLPSLKRKDAGLPKPRNARKSFANVDLPPSIRDEQEALTDLVSRYLVRVQSWKKCFPKKGSCEAIEALASQLLEKQEKAPASIPYQRQCLVIGMIQGMMLKEGILTAKDALEDHNTLYYVA